MGIAEDQNSPDNLRLLAAQRHLYTQAKRLHFWCVGGTVGLAATAPLVFLVWPASRTALAILGGVWTIISRLILEGVEANKTKQAATIQEQFDVDLFGLPWNRTLVGNKVKPELIHSAARSFHGDQEELKDWYADSGDIPRPLSTLLCQRTNLVWDWRLRRHYAWGISLATLALFSLGIILAVVTNQTVVDYILALFLPALAAILKGIEISRDHFKIAAEKEKVEKELSALWERGLKNPGLISEDHCRRIQDYIYVLRSQGPLVPDQWYAWLRDKYRIDMQLTVKEMGRQAEHALAHR